MTRAAHPMARCVWPGGAVLGEGPVWVAEEAALYWVDIKGKAVMRLTPATGLQQRWLLKEEIGCLAPHPEGGFVAALRNSGFCRLWLAADGSVELRSIVHPEPDLPGNRCNDGKLDPSGGFWCGTMDDGEQCASGSFWRLAPDGGLVRVDHGYVIANGPAFSPGGDQVYLTDSFRRTIWRAPLAPGGRIGEKRVFRQFAPEEGAPDGMSCDAAGRLWVALWGGGRVVCLSPAGEEVGAVRVPTPQVTSCAFAPDGRLYITTAAIGRADDRLAGGLFEARP